ncbi:hypothetical protein ACTXT7_003099 [Hymenolepis weldensis]
MLYRAPKAHINATSTSTGHVENWKGFAVIIITVAHKDINRLSSTEDTEYRVQAYTQRQSSLSSALLFCNNRDLILLL